MMKEEATKGKSWWRGRRRRDDSSVAVGKASMAAVAVVALAAAAEGGAGAPLTSLVSRVRFCLSRFFVLLFVFKKTKSEFASVCF